MHAAVPRVEVADDADAIRVGCPDGEVHAGGAADRHRVRAELVVDAGVLALAEQIEVVVGDDAAVAIRIVDLDGRAAVIRDAQAVIRNLGRDRASRFENARQGDADVISRTRSRCA